MSIRRARQDYYDLAETLAYWLAEHSPHGCHQCTDIARGCEAYNLRLDMAVSVRHASVRYAPSWLPTPATANRLIGGGSESTGRVYMSKGSR